GGSLPDVLVLNTHKGLARPDNAFVLQSDIDRFDADRCYPGGWPRISTTDANNYVTSFLYDGMGGRTSDIYYPNGRRWASRIVIIGADESITGSTDLVWNHEGYVYNLPAWTDQSQWFAREYVFNDVEVLGGVSRSRMIGEIRDYTNREA